MYVLVTGKRGDQFEEVLKSLNDDLAIAEATATIRALSSYDREHLTYADLYKVTERDHDRVQNSDEWDYYDLANGECWDILEVANMLDADDDEVLQVKPSCISQQPWYDYASWDCKIKKEDAIDLAYDLNIDAPVLFTQLMRI